MPSVPTLSQPRDADLLIFFRISFGSVMAYWSWQLLWSGSADAFYAQPRHHFPFPGFEWVHPWPAGLVRWHFVALGGLAVMLAAGLWYRLASSLFALGFTCTFLWDKCLYQNHYYLVCLLAWILAIVPAHRDGSLDALRSPDWRRPWVPLWCLALLRFQIAVPYVLGGIAKLDHDWLAGAPIRMMFVQLSGLPIAGSLLKYEWTVQVFVWGGLLFDLLVVPGLLWRPTRGLALVLSGFFHLTNAVLFPIGIFPWLMLPATLVFLPAGSLRRAYCRWFSKFKAPTDHFIQSEVTPNNGWLAVALSLYVGLQLLVPLRHWIIPGDVNWTEEGHCFSWHMLRRGKQAAVRYDVWEPSSGRRGSVDLRTQLADHQMQRLGRDPRMIQQLAVWISDDLREQGFPQVEIRALTLVSLNGRRPQPIIDPSVNLLGVSCGWWHAEWITELREPLRDPPWSLPLPLWEEAIRAENKLRSE